MSKFIDQDRTFHTIVLVMTIGFAIAVVFTLLIRLENVEWQLDQREDEVSTLNRDVRSMAAQLSRDDELFTQLLGGWDRSQPVLTKEVTVTCYTSRRKETDSTPHTTASNRKVRPGTLAVSRDLLPLVGGYGAKVVLAGYGLFEVTDVMNKRFTNSVDIWTGDLKMAQLHGRQVATMVWQTGGE